MSESGSTPGSKFKFSTLLSATSSPRAIDQGKFTELELGSASISNQKQSSPPTNNEKEELEAMEEMSLKKWREYTESSSSIVSDALIGQMVSKLQCVKCKGASYSFEPFFMLELAIPQQQDPITLQELFSQFGKQDLLENILWDCPKCKVKRPVLKSNHIWKFPPVLIIYLKRFESTAEGFRKNDCLVTVDLKGEDFSPFLASPRKSPLRYSPYLFIVLSA
jgi:ubiquitin C-terminal hydrolase